MNRNINKNISSLNDGELITAVERLRSAEHLATADFLLHLIEIDKRKLYREKGYSSLFSYLTMGLLYSEPAAYRRLSSARMIARFAELHQMFLSKDVSLSTLSRVSRVLCEENRAELIPAISGKSRAEVDAIVARYQARTKKATKTRELVKPICVAKHCASPNSTGDLFNSGSSERPRKNQSANKTLAYNARTTSLKGSNHNFKLNLSQKRDNPGPTDRDLSKITVATAKTTPEPALEDKFELRFSVGKKFMAKLTRATALESNKGPQATTLEAVFEQALDEYLSKHCPKERIKRREQRTAKAANSKRDAASKKQQSSNTKSKKSGGNGGHKCAEHRNDGLMHAKRSINGQKLADQPVAKPGNRYIPQQTRDEVFRRDDGRCIFISKDGVRCNAIHQLEIDHILPWAKGGSNDASNLRLLCKAHNQLAAEQQYGAQFIRSFHAVGRELSASNRIPRI